MHPGRASSSRRLGVPTALAAALLGAFVGAVPFGGAASAAPPYTLDERATAIVSPSLVFVEARLEGFMRIRATGALVEPNPIQVYSRCSGFVVNPDGYLVSTTHCLQPSPDSLRGSASFTAANDMIRDKKLNPDQKAGFIKQLMATADFTGATRESAPTTKIFGQLFVGTPGAPDATAIPGQLVDARPVTAGDVALVKLSKKGLPAAQVNTVSLNADAHVVAVGFGTNDANSATAPYTVQSRSSKIVGQNGNGSPPTYKMDGAIGNASHGGMVVDANGQVVGMITADMAAKDRTNQLVTDTTVIGDLLASSGVKNTLGSTDQAYRAGLDAYFGGRYTEAIRKFDAVLAALPQDVPAQTYRKQAKDRLAIEGDRSAGMPAWVLGAAAVAGIVVLAVIVLIVVMLLRRRARRRERTPLLGPYPPRPGMPVSAIPISGAPVSGVPVSGVPVSGVPVSGVPVSGVPVSGVPVSGVPTSGVPTSGAGTVASEQPNAGHPPAEAQPPFRAGSPLPAQYQQYTPGPPPEAPSDQPPVPPSSETSWPAFAPQRDQRRERPPAEADDTAPGAPVPTEAEAAARRARSDQQQRAHDQWMPPPATP